MYSYAPHYRHEFFPKNTKVASISIVSLIIFFECFLFVFPMRLRRYMWIDVDSTCLDLCTRMHDAVLWLSGLAFLSHFSLSFLFFFSSYSILSSLVVASSRDIDGSGSDS